jgi:predicted metal-dependent HD superfamily phosphohydrolase
MTDQTTALTAHWNRLMARLEIGPKNSGELERLLALWSGPDRHYHTQCHLLWLLDEIDRQSALLAEPERLYLAAWYHDAIYDTQRQDNEAMSADLARDSLGKMQLGGALIDRVCALILSTAAHRSGGTDRDDDLFLDMDCAILGAGNDRYDAYAAEIQAEYAWVPADLYQEGRGQFLEMMSNEKQVFLTPEYEARLGDQARENMRRELNTLKAAI